MQYGAARIAVCSLAAAVALVACGGSSSRTLDTPRKHLTALGVPLDLGAPKVRPIGVTRAFDFYSGRWKLFTREDFVGAVRHEGS